MLLIYSLILIVMIIFTFQILSKLKSGATFNKIQNNIFVSMSSWVTKLGKAYNPIFYIVHVGVALLALASGAWITALILMPIYLVAHAKLYNRIKSGAAPSPIPA